MLRMIGIFGLLVAHAAAPGGCEAANDLVAQCDVLYRGIKVEHGTVTDVVHPVCDRRPEWHVLHAWIEYKRIGEYSRLSQRDAVTRDIPDQSGFSVPVSVPDCVEGWYRTAAHVEGAGPASEQYPKGIPFDRTLYSAHTYLTVDDCQEGT